jgi:hypothetical protein
MAREPLKRLDIRLFIADPNAVEWGEFLPLFTRWAQEEPDRWLDVADYRHVPTGPKVVLIGKECHVSVDNRREEAALLFSRREPYEGSNEERIASAFRDAFAYAERVSRELPHIRFRHDVCELAVNDRVAFPNEPEIAEAVAAELRSALAALMPNSTATLEHDPNPKERITFRVRLGE